MERVWRDAQSPHETADGGEQTDPILGHYGTADWQQTTRQTTAARYRTR